VLGGVCEDGTTRLDPHELARASSDPDRERALARARTMLAEESTALRGNQWIGDVRHRLVVLVTDALDEPWSILAASDVLRRLGASRVVVAAPVATVGAGAVVEKAVDELVVVHATDDSAVGATLYRDARLVGTRAAARRLRRATAAPSRTP
jgi:putative phosphoribosyl transferase